MAATHRTFGEVTYHLDDDDGIATVTLCRPPSNFFDAQSVADLHHALVFGADEGARAIVLASAGKHFCAGIEFGRTDVKHPTELYSSAADIFATPVPIVAAVQGAAVGGGLGLALAADFRVASPQTRFWANFTSLGLHQGFGISITLPAVVGQQRAAEMLLTARRVDGEEAKTIGLCDRLVPDDDIAGQARGLALEIAACAPLSVRAARATLRGDLAEQVRAVTKLELAEQLRLAKTDDFREGVRALRERRNPVFSGR